MRRRALLGGLGAAVAGSLVVGRTRAQATAGFGPIGSLAVEGAREAVVGPDGTTVYLATLDGFAVVDVSDPAEPAPVAEHRSVLADAPDGPLVGIQEVAVDGDQLLVMGPAHPRPDAVNAAVLFDVSNPEAPERLAVHRTVRPIHNGELVDGVAYLTGTDADRNPLDIVAMAGERAPDGPTHLARWSLLDADVDWIDVAPGLRGIHDVLVDGGVAYCSLWDAGTWLVDVSEPASPRAIGHVGERSIEALAAVEDPGIEAGRMPGNHHSAAVDGALLAVGHEALPLAGPGGIDLVDLADPTAPTTVARIAPEGPPDQVATGHRATAHNFALRDGRLYSAWYRAGLRVHDLADPAAPREVASWRAVESASLWTAQLATDAIVASSMGTPDGDPGLYTFPLPADSAGADTASTPVPTTTRAPTPTPTPTPSRGQPGFGLGVAALGVGVASLLRRRRG